MPRDGAIIFGDLIGKLDTVRVECPKCGRSGRYRLADLITRYGRKAKISTFTDELIADCGRRREHSDSHPCGAICPDLPVVRQRSNSGPSRYVRFVPFAEVAGPTTISARADPATPASDPTNSGLW